MNVFESSIIITLQNNIFSGLFVGQNLLTLKEVDSTNNFLKNLLSNSKPLPEGTVIMAETQFAGRGQQNNKWHAEPGKNLTFSVLLKPSFLAIADQFDLTRAISLGVYDALYPLLGDQLKIKWPNDIYYGDKKLGGMLIENLLQGNQLKSAIIGIGLNINQENFPDGAGNATSIKQILQKDYDLQAILADICNNIEAYYLNLKAGKTDLIRNTYLTRLYGFNEIKRFKVSEVEFEGKIIGVKENGLLVINQNNKESTYNLKEIKFLNN
ncbi:biotin--[acetyl-CoA-carboxylase] ligase [Mucilaginibacter sp. UR6-11]|uniref:biotin--[acetyl-CoA-carboxylase] ligase n=1 Tax=Mucilaginibacter sp. UR6-11 TaxID=1435644 RepID=UPI001E3167D7|nr:biotin--[acetyl-CoA-carboxylase] ligase [Mucilaginibacter sp. UR6-11]MCC8424427.1 biotin--[acetyl-CoA-carboxylase] ligase [Mucilaginibacter sp. UR6-11]